MTPCCPDKGAHPSLCHQMLQEALPRPLTTRSLFSSCWCSPIGAVGLLCGEQPQLHALATGLFLSRCHQYLHIPKELCTNHTHTDCHQQIARLEHLQAEGLWKPLLWCPSALRQQGHVPCLQITFSPSPAVRKVNKKFF